MSARRPRSTSEGPWSRAEVERVLRAYVSSPRGVRRLITDTVRALTDELPAAPLLAVWLGYAAAHDRTLTRADRERVIFAVVAYRNRLYRELGLEHPNLWRRRRPRRAGGGR